MDSAAVAQVADAVRARLGSSDRASNGTGSKDDLAALITSEVLRRLRCADPTFAVPPGRLWVPIGISARHVHLSQADVERLFGAGYRLKARNPLYQHEQFAAEETVTLVGPRMRAIEEVRVLGPARGETQVEIARTDGFALGLEPPVRPSGELAGTPGIVIVGPKGALVLAQGVIRANRHIHLGPAEAAPFGIADGDVFDVEIEGPKAAILRGVQCRVDPAFRAELHLDTDDANAVDARCGVLARVRVEAKAGTR